MTHAAPRERLHSGHAPASRKLARVVQPTEQERFFDRQDIIVSKTDLKGALTYVNRVFTAIAGYEETELLGQPHSIIRHPDMPRTIFKLLWERLHGGNEVFAYVKNMTKTGDFYWVHAHVTPSVNPSGGVVGFHSNRRVPDRRVVDETIVPLYRLLKAIENQEPDRRAGLEKSSEAFKSILTEKGIGYDEFVFGL